VKWPCVSQLYSLDGLLAAFCSRTGAVLIVAVSRRVFDDRRTPGAHPVVAARAA